MEKHGRGKRRTFSAEYKAEAVRLVNGSGKSIGVIARELGLGDGLAALGTAGRDRFWARSKWSVDDQRTGRTGAVTA